MKFSGMIFKNNLYERRFKAILYSGFRNPSFYAIQKPAAYAILYKKKNNFQFYVENYHISCII